MAAVTLITAGALVLTDRAGATSLGWAGIAMVCLALLTTGVLVGAWFGSARWLIAPALAAAGTSSGAFHAGTRSGYLKAGEVMEAKIKGIGTLRNGVVAGPAPPPASSDARLPAVSSYQKD